MPYVSAATLQTLLPEIVLIGGATVIFLAGAFVHARSAWCWLAGFVVAAAAVCCYGQAADGYSLPADAAGSPLLADSLLAYIRWLALGLGALLLLATARGAADSQASEFVGALLIAVAGVMLVAGAGDLVMLFLGLEMISIPTYVLLYLGRRDAAGQESALKYFYLSIFSSAVMLYGFSFLYGVAGSMHLANIQQRLAPLPGATPLPMMTTLALVLIMAGLGFKMAAVPFHFYAPDVYQGTRHSVAAVLAVLPKVAGVAALARVASLFAGAEGLDLAWIIILLLAAATMTVGNVLGLWQGNLRRLLGYSSIAHSGYLLIGVAVSLAATSGAGRDQQLPGMDGLQAALFYVLVYGIATIGTFALLEHLGDGERQIDDVHELAGLGQTRPMLAIALVVLLLSLAGMPPLAGFLGKLTLFYAAVGTQSPADSRITIAFLALAAIGALNAAIAAAYYLRVIAALYFAAPQRASVTGASVAGESRGITGSRGALAAGMLCLLLAIGLGLFPTFVVQSAQQAAQSLRWKK